MDAAEIYRTIDQQRSYLGQWLPFVATTQSVNDSLDFINSILKAAEEKDVCVFTIRYKDAFAGIIGLKGTDFANKKTEIGYWLAEEYQGQGMMTRCVETICQRAFHRMDINRIQIKCACGNHRSRAIPQRLGFALEGIERDGEMMSNQHFVDLEVYSMLKADWHKRS